MRGWLSQDCKPGSELLSSHAEVSNPDSSSPFRIQQNSLTSVASFGLGGSWYPHSLYRYRHLNRPEAPLHPTRPGRTWSPGWACSITVRPRSSTYSRGSCKKGKATGRPSTWRRREAGGGATSGQWRGKRRTDFPRVLGFTHRDRPALQQPHGHVSQQHGHLVGPGHAAPAPVIVGHVHAVTWEAQMQWSAGTGVRGQGEGRGSCAPKVASTAVLGQHVAAAALEVQQAAVEGAVMRVSEGHAGSGPGQAAGTAAAGTQGGGLVLASAPDTVRHAEPPGARRIAGEAPGLTPGGGVRAPPRGYFGNCTTRASPASFFPGAPRGAVPSGHPSHRLRQQHSRARRRAAGSAGSGSSRRRLRRSSWYRRPRPSAPRRPPAGPGARTTGRGLRGQ